jgi:hypothetical protein
MLALDSFDIGIFSFIVLCQLLSVDQTQIQYLEDLAKNPHQKYQPMRNETFIPALSQWVQINIDPSWYT